MFWDFNNLKLSNDKSKPKITRTKSGLRSWIHCWNLLFKESCGAWFNNLSFNLNAIELLEENQDKIDYHYLSANPSIFTYDYDLIKEKNKEYLEIKKNKIKIKKLQKNFFFFIY